MSKQLKQADYRGYKNIYGQKYWEYMGRQIAEILERHVKNRTRSKNLEKKKKQEKQQEETTTTNNQQQIRNTYKTTRKTKEK